MHYQDYELISIWVFRELKIGRHFVFYRVMNGRKVEITRVLHNHMDLKNSIIEK